MPIVNGSYVYDQMPVVGKDSYEAMTGDKWSRKDWSDTTSAQYNYLLKQQENAFNVEMWNLANQYNSPAEQMKRYQDAGLNPNLIYGQQNTTSPIQAAANQAFRSQGTHAKQTANQLATIGQMESIIKSARDTYDYLSYGMKGHSLDNALKGQQILNTQESAIRTRYENEWNDFLLHGSFEPGFYDPEDARSLIPTSPRGKMYQTQSDIKQAEWDKLEYFVNTLMPDQHSANVALTKLRENQADIQNGKYGAILDIDLGLGQKVNQWARLVLFIAMARMM